MQRLLHFSSSFLAASLRVVSHEYQASAMQVVETKNEPVTQECPHIQNFLEKSVVKVQNELSDVDIKKSKTGIKKAIKKMNTTEKEELAQRVKAAQRHPALEADRKEIKKSIQLLDEMKCSELVENKEQCKKTLGQIDKTEKKIIKKEKKNLKLLLEILEFPFLFVGAFCWVATEKFLIMITILMLISGFIVSGIVALAHELVRSPLCHVSVSLKNSWFCTGRNPFQWYKKTVKPLFE